MITRSAMLLAASLSCSIASPPAAAAGPYDGIWAVSYQGGLVGYVTANERDGTLIAVILVARSYTWEALIGPRTGNLAYLITAAGPVLAQASVTFTSDTTFTATQIACVPQLPGWICALPAGAIVQGTKIW